jgi:hypothetical protein
MNERKLSLDPAERQFLALTIAADELWPPREDLERLLDQVPGGDHAGGPRLRATLLALALRGPDEGEYALAVSPSELWLLDGVLIRRDLRREKLPDGRPLAELASKVWELILDVHEDHLPHDLRKEAKHAGDEDANQDASEVVASAEAILRSRHSEGAEGDLPAAAA